MMATSINALPANVYRKNLTSSRDASLAAPAPDQEVGWHQHGFPEEIEEDQIHSGKDAQSARLQGQQKKEKWAGVGIFWWFAFLFRLRP
jgi:hypothetical protein